MIKICSESNDHRDFVLWTMLRIVFKLLDSDFIAAKTDGRTITISTSAGKIEKKK